MPMDQCYNSVATPARRMSSMENIEKSWWSPPPGDERKGRDREAGGGGGGTVKVRSMNGNTRALRGGDWVSSGFSNATLAVAWTHHGKCNKKYGLTVARVFTKHALGVGAPVFAFDADEAEMTKPGGTKGHKPIKIGTVTSIDMQSDSAVFEIFDPIKIDPLAVALSGGDDQVCRITLPTPGANGVPPAMGKRLVMFGAARHGMIGRRVQPDTKDVSTEFATRSYETTPEGKVETNGVTKLSFSSDCGALYLDQDGNPWSMHTAIQGWPKTNPTCWTSRGSSLQDIVDAHPLFSNHNSQRDDALNSSLHHRNRSSPAGTHRRDEFTVALEKIVCLTTEDQNPSLCFPGDPDSFIEDRALPMSYLPLAFSNGEFDSTPSNAQDEETKIDY